MKAIILAAGYATRLYPLTKDKPKALLPVNGKPIIDYIVEQLMEVDAVDEVIVVSNHKFAASFHQWAVERAFLPKPMTVLDDGTTTEENRRGAIGDIQFAITTREIDDELLVIAGDNLFTFRLADYHSFYKAAGCDCVVAKELDDIKLLRQFAVAKLDEKGKILELVEKPENPRSNVAVYATYMYTRDTARLIGEYLAQGNKPDAPGYFVQWLYKRKDVYAYRIDGECIDIGTLKSYEEAQLRFAAPGGERP